MNEASGLAITTSCEDVEGALQFINDLLSQEVHDLRYWGVEGEDYEVDENGLFYKTEEQRLEASDTAYKASHCVHIPIFHSMQEPAGTVLTLCSHSISLQNFFDGFKR